MTYKYINMIVTPLLCIIQIKTFILCITEHNKTKRSIMLYAHKSVMNIYI